MELGLIYKAIGNYNHQVSLKFLPRLKGNKYETNSRINSYSNCAKQSVPLPLTEITLKYPSLEDAAYGRAIFFGNGVPEND